MSLDNYIVKDNGCWLWQGAIDRDGYGKAKYNYRMEQAHRIIYILANKLSIDHTIHVHHEVCKTKNCVNPSHMKHITREEHNTIEKSKIDDAVGNWIIEQYKNRPAWLIAAEAGLSCTTVTKFLKSKGLMKQKSKVRLVAS